MDIRSFAMVVRNEEIAHRTTLDIGRLASSAEFDAKLCFTDEEESRKLYESAGQKLRKAEKLFDDAMADYFVAASKWSDSDDQRSVINKYVRYFRLGKTQ